MKDIPYSKKVGQANIFSSSAIIFIISCALIYLFSHSIIGIEKEHSKQTRDNIFQAKKEYIREVVNMIFHVIDTERSACDQLEGVPGKENKNAHLPVKGSCSKESIQERMKTLIRNTRLKDNGYIWVNYVLDLDGGDKYAIRLVHPNLEHTEGMSLSTKMKDIKGNTPYLTELEGVRQNGEIFFDYWFKKMNSDRISHKLTFAKLYHDYNWIIATGVYLDDIDELVALEEKNTHELLVSVIRKPISILFGALLFALFFALFFHRKILKTIKVYSDEVKDKEIFLETFNKELEEKVKQRTQEVLDKSVILEENERKLLAAQKIARVGYWDFDVGGGKLSWSDETYRIFGFTAQQFIPTFEKFNSILHPDDHEMVHKRLEAALSGTEEYNLDFRFLKPKGDIGWIHCRGEVTWDDQGNPLRFFGTQIDVTGRKKAEKEIKTLRGILPICMHCKEIRDTKGYWNRIEKYISENADVQFSHGICENCLKKHYSELLD